MFFCFFVNVFTSPALIATGFPIPTEGLAVHPFPLVLVPPYTQHTSAFARLSGPFHIRIRMNDREARPPRISARAHTYIHKRSNSHKKIRTKVIKRTRARARMHTDTHVHTHAYSKQAIQPNEQKTFSGTRPAFGQTCPQSPPAERMSGNCTLAKNKSYKKLYISI